jgi:competence protein ComGC
LRDKQKGVTLIEALIVVVIVSFAFLGIGVLYVNCMKSWWTGKSKIYIRESAQRLLQHVKYDLSGVHRSSINNLVENPSFEEDPSKNILKNWKLYEGSANDINLSETNLKNEHFIWEEFASHEGKRCISINTENYIEIDEGYDRAYEIRQCIYLVKPVDEFIFGGWARGWGVDIYQEPSQQTDGNSKPTNSWCLIAQPKLKDYERCFYIHWDPSNSHWQYKQRKVRLKEGKKTDTILLTLRYSGDKGVVWFDAVYFSVNQSIRSAPKVTPIYGTDYKKPVKERKEYFHLTCTNPSDPTHVKRYTFYQEEKEGKLYKTQSDEIKLGIEDTKQGIKIFKSISRFIDFSRTKEKPPIRINEDVIELDLSMSKQRTEGTLEGEEASKANEVRINATCIISPRLD